MSVGSVATGFAFAALCEWRRIGVPGTRGGLQPVDDVSRIGRCLTGQRALGEDALDGLGHVQPRSAERRVERHDAMFEQPVRESALLCPGKDKC